MNEINITISLADYDAFLIAKYQVDAIKRVIENDTDYDYTGLSAQTEGFILSLLDVKKGSAVNA